MICQMLKNVFKRLRLTRQCLDTRLNVRALPCHAELKHLKNVYEVWRIARTLEQRQNVRQS